MAIEVQGMAPLLHVFDMPTSIAFYCDVLGFEIVSTDGTPAPHFDWALLRLNGVELMLNTAYEAHQRPPMPDPVRVAAHQSAPLNIFPFALNAYPSCRCPARVSPWANDASRRLSNSSLMYRCRSVARHDQPSGEGDLASGPGFYTHTNPLSATRVRMAWPRCLFLSSRPQHHPVLELFLKCQT
jgi:hypothetical protein